MDLTDVTKLFSAHNRSRLERLFELAPPTHQSFLQLLPLIFQSNDPSLPCYVEGAPFGIVDYQPTDNLLTIAKKLHPALTYKKHAFRHYSLQGLYLINDAGSLNYPEQARYDLWLVYASSCTEQEAQLLKTKLHDVVNRAKSIGIKLNARLLNDAAIKGHHISADELDRFYSSGLILAGCTPLWWLVSPEEEHDYSQRSQQLTASPPANLSLLDFGPLTSRATSSLVDTAIRASIHVLEFGIPAYLDLLYQQALFDRPTDSTWLSSDYKKQIYSNQSNTFYCEPYLLKYTFLNELLPSDLLAYARQSLYLIANERLSTDVRSPRFPWRRENMTDLVREWNWNNQELNTLDQRAKGQIRERLNEFRLTQKLIAEFIKKIERVIKQAAPEASKNLAKLIRHYDDVFDSPPDVIPTLPARLIPETSEDFLFVEYLASTKEWIITEFERTNVKKGEGNDPLFSNNALLRVIAWAVLNGALSKHTRVKLISNNRDVTTNSLHSLIEHLLKSTFSPELNTPDSFNWLMFANTEQTPPEAYKQQDIKLAVRLRDPLNYSYHRKNIVVSLEVLVRISDNKWSHLSFDGSNAIGEALASYIRWLPLEAESSRTDCWCPTPSFSNTIATRLKSLFDALSKHAHLADGNGIYILEVGDQICRIQWQQQQCDTQHFARRYDLDTVLSLARTEAYLTQIDDHLDHEGLYKILLKYQQKHENCIFIDAQKSHIDVYLLDELGHLDKQRHTSLKETTLLTNLNQFLSAIVTEQDKQPPHFYKLHNTFGDWSYKVLSLPQAETTNSYLPVRIRMKQPKVDADCTIICGQKQFSGKANDAALFQQVSQLILSLRQSSHSFALYITELTFEQTTPIPTTHDHIIFKQHLEKLLNER